MYTLKDYVGYRRLPRADEDAGLGAFESWVLGDLLLDAGGGGSEALLVRLLRVPHEQLAPRGRAVRRPRKSEQEVLWPSVEQERAS